MIVANNVAAPFVYNSFVSHWQMHLQPFKRNKIKNMNPWY